MILRDVFDLSVSLGTVSATRKRLSTKLAAACNEAVEYVRARQRKNLDGSTWRLAGELRGLWTIACSLVTVFFVVGDSTRETIEKLVGDVRGVLTTQGGSDPERVAFAA